MVEQPLQRMKNRIAGLPDSAGRHIWSGLWGSDEDVLVAEQIAYYRARAAEFDRPYAERADLQELLAVADALPIVGDVLELACGTGKWTRKLAARANSVTAVDAAAEMLALARTRTRSAPQVERARAAVHRDDQLAADCAPAAPHDAWRRGARRPPGDGPKSSWTPHRASLNSQRGNGFGPSV